MNLLVLGGTRFVGRHLVEAALARDHDVVLFHRGRSGAELFPELEHVLGDRDGGLDALGERSFDAVVDVCGYVPRIVGDSVRRLADRAGRYAFVSTMSVYADQAARGIDEDAELARTDDPTSEDPTGERYGPLKALCEAEVRSGFGERALVVRPGLVVGPYDPTDRFTYWVERGARGGEVLAPAPAGAPVQFIDARDLAAWTVRLVEEDSGETLHAVCPPRSRTMADVVETCLLLGAAEADTRVEWVDPGWLLEQDVAGWSDLPLWLPYPHLAGYGHADTSRARASGLTVRPLDETVRDTLAWSRERRDGERACGLSAEREGELLRRWHGRAGG